MMDKMQGGKQSEFSNNCYQTKLFSVATFYDIAVNIAIIPVLSQQCVAVLDYIVAITFTICT